VLNQTLDFLFSERGAFIRENLIDEIVKGVDTLGRRSFQNFTYSLRERVGMTVNEAPPTVETSQSLDHIKRIWDILQETKGFDAMQLLPVIPQLLMKPETQRMGKKLLAVWCSE
jgi:hypothetical protein